MAGTTRDTIEEVMNIDGLLFRFIDTAGIRAHTDDAVEQQGIARSRQKAAVADIVIRLVDIQAAKSRLQKGKNLVDDDDYRNRQGQSILVISKMDEADESERLLVAQAYPDALFIAAKHSTGVDTLKEAVQSRVMLADVQPGDTIITNTRHLAALQKIASAVADIKAGLDQDIPSDLIALDIRQALHYIGELTGQVLHDRDVLGAIFGKFCIGK